MANIVYDNAGKAEVKYEGKERRKSRQEPSEMSTGNDMPYNPFAS